MGAEGGERRSGYEYGAPLDPTSPWPKFRRDLAQTGLGAVAPVDSGGAVWSFETGNGVFSSPVIDGEGTAYIGSADQYFYAIGADGRLRWRFRTGEVIDSSALLDDGGRVIFGSGDGTLYALDRISGEVAWTFAAEPPSSSESFINWFEGNVAMGPDGTLYVPNDNFRVYALDRATRTVRWSFATLDQTWALPAVSADGSSVFLANNFQMADNMFAVDAGTGSMRWSAASKGSMVASPLLTSAGDRPVVVYAGFDGVVRALDQATGETVWTFGARDHLYASPALTPSGVVVAASADGSVYGLDPTTGAVRWQHDLLEPCRSSPAVDPEGNIYLGSGDGRLHVLDADGSPRWSILLNDDERSDVNSSPALGPHGIVVAAENGTVYGVPYHYGLRPGIEHDDPRVTVGAGEQLPASCARLLLTTCFGHPRLVAPVEIEANQPLTFSLVVRDAGTNRLAVLDSASVEVALDPPVSAIVDVSGDRTFVSVVPNRPYTGPPGGPLTVRVRGTYLVDPDRDGLRFTGGRPGGQVEEVFRFDVRGRGDGSVPLPFPVPAAPGEPSGALELYRLAAPLPTILPSYNQIGFASIHYLLGLVEGDDGRAVAWAVGGRLGADDDRTVVDPASETRFALEVVHDGGLLTLINEQGFTIEFNGFPLPFEYFRVSTRLDPSGRSVASPATNTKTVCSKIDFYGPFLQQLGYCNPVTDLLDVVGGAELRPWGAGVVEAPAGVGAVSFAVDSGVVRAELAGSEVRVGEHNLGVLLVDVLTGRPVPLDYAKATTVAARPDGTVASVEVVRRGTPGPTTVRAYLMVDTYPAARQVLELRD